jgi:hypothetical protein
MGTGFRIRERAQALIHPEGTAGQRLHGERAADGKSLPPMNNYGAYEYLDGKMYSSVVNVEWLLNDVGPYDGGKYLDRSCSYGFHVYEGASVWIVVWIRTVYVALLDCRAWQFELVPGFFAVLLLL